MDIPDGWSRLDDGLVAPLGHVKVGLLILVSEQRMKERVDEIAVPDLVGHVEQAEQEQVKLGAPLLGNDFDGTPADRDALRQTWQAIGDEREAQTQLLVQFGELAMTSEQVRSVRLLLSLHVHDVHVILFRVVPLLASYYSGLLATAS